MNVAIRLMGAVVGALGIAGVAMAQDYPTKPVRLLVGQPAGGPTDIVARLLAQKLQERWSQPVVVENRPGAGSNIATDLAVKAPKDGYTLLLATVQPIVNPFLYANLGWDPVRDLAAVSLVSKAHIVLVVNPELPVKSVEELVALAKAKPGDCHGHQREMEVPAI